MLIWPMYLLLEETTFSLELELGCVWMPEVLFKSILQAKIYYFLYFYESFTNSWRSSE